MTPEMGEVNPLQFITTMASIAEIGVAELVGGIVALAASLITWYVRKMYKDWSDRGDKLDELYRAIFGMEEVSTMEGVVEIVDTHDNEIVENKEMIKELEDKFEDGKEKRKELEQRVEGIKQRIEERNGDNT